MKRREELVAELRVLVAPILPKEDSDKLLRIIAQSRLRTLKPFEELSEDQLVQLRDALAQDKRDRESNSAFEASWAYKIVGPILNRTPGPILDLIYFGLIALAILIFLARIWRAFSAASG